MNWEPNSWNTRKFTVAQSDGLFKHVDRGNIGALVRTLGRLCAATVAPFFPGRYILT